MTADRWYMLGIDPESYGGHALFRCDTYTEVPIGFMYSDYGYIEGYNLPTIFLTLMNTNGGSLRTKIVYNYPDHSVSNITIPYRYDPSKIREETISLLCATHEEVESLNKGLDLAYSNLTGFFKCFRMSPTTTPLSYMMLTDRFRK